MKSLIVTAAIALTLPGFVSAQAIDPTPPPVRKSTAPTTSDATGAESEATPTATTADPATADPATAADPTPEAPAEAAPIEPAITPATASNDDLEIDDAYVRTTASGTGAAFMTVKVKGSRACELTDVASTAADKTELLESRDLGTRMKTASILPWKLEPGSSNELMRGANHIRFSGFKERFDTGAEIPLTLVFGECGTIEAKLPVDNNRRSNPIPGADYILGGGE